MATTRKAPAEPGSYLLCLTGPGAGDDIQVGALGRLALQSGRYLYAGSAFGPGGLAARLQHHFSVSQRPHWHIDYLRAQCAPLGAWFVLGKNLEHQFARYLQTLAKARRPLAGFGASDCACATHLYTLPESVSREELESDLAAYIGQTPYWTAPD